MNLHNLNLIWCCKFSSSIRRLSSSLILLVPSNLVLQQSCKIQSLLTQALLVLFFLDFFESFLLLYFYLLNQERLCFNSYKMFGLVMDINPRPRRSKITILKLTSHLSVFLQLLDFMQQNSVLKLDVCLTNKWCFPT